MYESLGQLQKRIVKFHLLSFDGQDIQAGLDQDVTWVDIDDLQVATQMWAGWPHPNPEGHSAIGSEIADVIVG